jgi:regulator of protease activity HflC (stomatin/prohibitin superfamily)
MNRSVSVVLIVLVVILVVASLALFTVDQRQNAIGPRLRSRW